MFTERLQVLMTKAQRRRLEDEARQRGTSVGALIREAVDARQRRTPITERRRAVHEITAMRGRPFLSVDEIERIVDEEREGVLVQSASTRRSRRQ